MAPKKKPVGAMIRGGGAALLVLVAMAAVLLPSYIERGRLQAISERLQSEDAATVAKALDALRAYRPRNATVCCSSDTVQTKLFAYFNRHARAAFDVSSGSTTSRARVAGAEGSARLEQSV